MKEAAARIDLADEFYEEPEVLAFMGIKQMTMRWRRCNAPGKVPPYIKLGDRFVYPKKEFREFLMKQVKK